MKKKEAELLLKTALESEKEERQRIAKDLHDSVSSDFSAIRNYLVLIKKTEIDEQKILLFPICMMELRPLLRIPA